jgi:hypothetical protein
MVFALPFLFSLYLYFANDWVDKSDVMLTLIAINLLMLLIPIALILSAYRNRKKEQCWIEDDAIVKYRRETLIFKIPLNKIVSIRVQDRKGNSGSIIFFTNDASKNYWHTYIPINVYLPMSVYGLTEQKINHIKDRKWLIRQLLEVNPQLHFIESH